MRYGPTEINKSPAPARLAFPSEYLLLIINEAKMELQLGEPHYLSGLQTNKFIDERRQSERDDWGISDAFRQRAEGSNKRVFRLYSGYKVTFHKLYETGLSAIQNLFEIIIFH